MSTRSTIKRSTKAVKPKKRASNPTLNTIQFFIWMAIMLAIFAH